MTEVEVHKVTTIAGISKLVGLYAPAKPKATIK